MKLILNNFRCYKGSHSFDFEPDGMTLISGVSGAGKTSLLMAIYFAITGNCPPKVISDGCDSCSVSLIVHPELTITRTRRPNRVVVSGKENLEDDLAQQYIHRHFGKYFDITSYIQQQYQKTFLYQSPTEKLEILEKLCFGDEFNPEEIKNKCSVHYKKLNHEHIALRSRLNTLTNLLETIEQKEPPIEIPQPDPLHKQHLEKRLQQLQNQEQRYYEQLGIQKQISDYQNQIQVLKTEIEQLEKQSVLYTKEQLQEHLTAKKQFLAINKEMISKPVWTKHSKDECEEMINDYKRDIQLHKEYHSLQKQIQECLKIEKQRQTIVDKKQKLIEAFEGQYECPECNTPLCLLNNELVVQIETRTILPANQKKKLIQHLDLQLEELQKQLQSFEHYKSKYNEIEQQIDITENVKDLEQDYAWITEYYKTNIDLSAKQQLLSQQQEQLQRKIIPELSIEPVETIEEQLKWFHTHSKLHDKLEYIQRQYQNILKKANESDPLSLTDSIKPDFKQQIETCKQSITEYQEQVHRYELFQIRQTQYLKFLEYQSQILTTQQQVYKLERQMTASLEFKQLVLRTESEIIDLKISEISRCVNTYLEQIFTEPITVELKTIKKTQTQNEKVQIQLEVYYKNMKCDVSLLSGGEQARMNLAFILAFAYTFKSPLLLLDECTSNLDQDLTEVVIEQIQSIGIPKVILIAHQIVEGNFKQILMV